jgi:hypothetical protein
MEIKSDHTDKVYSYLALRKAVGWIGILLPIVLVLGHLIIFDGESAAYEHERLLSYRYA